MECTSRQSSAIHRDKLTGPFSRLVASVAISTYAKKSPEVAAVLPKMLQEYATVRSTVEKFISFALCSLLPARRASSPVAGSSTKLD